MAERIYDVIVVGGGTAGWVAAALSAAGDTTARQIDVEQLRHVLKREGAVL